MNLKGNHFMIGYLWSFYIRCQEQKCKKRTTEGEIFIYFFLGGGGNEQNEHRYRPLQLMAFAGPGWQSTCIKRSSSLISCGMLINLIFEDIQSSNVVWSRDTGVYSLYGCINSHVHNAWPKKIYQFLLNVFLYLGDLRCKREWFIKQLRTIVLIYRDLII